MATKKKSGSRATLVEGCGTILKTNRLKHGYTLVKRKKVAGTTSETVTAPAKRRGRPAKMKPSAIVVPTKRRGRRKATSKA